MSFCLLALAQDLSLLALGVRSAKGLALSASYLSYIVCILRGPNIQNPKSLSPSPRLEPPQSLTETPIKP